MMATSAICQWCGVGKVVDSRGTVLCRHCDDGHISTGCSTCSTLVAADVVFKRNGP